LIFQKNVFAKIKKIKNKGVAIDPTCIGIERLQCSANDENAIIWRRLQPGENGLAMVKPFLPASTHVKKMNVF